MDSYVFLGVQWKYTSDLNNVDVKYFLVYGSFDSI
jgi:hypothetical protein